MAQGKKWDKDKVITEVLKPYFLLGYSVNKACILGRIPQQTVDTWIQKDPELRLKIESWQNYPSSKAREATVKSIVGDEEKGIKPNVNDAKWWLEKRESDEFSGKEVVEHTADDDIKTILRKLFNVREGEDEKNGSGDVPESEGETVSSD